MALIKCPECEQSVSDKASKCPKCGYPIQEYLSQKGTETKAQNCNDAAARVETFVDMQQIPIQKESKKKGIIATLMDRLQGLKQGVSKKKIIVAAIVASIAVVAVLGIVLASQFFAPRLTVEDISVSKWRLTNSTKYGDYYEGIITSEQKSPFVAVIGEYEDGFVLYTRELKEGGNKENRNVVRNMSVFLSDGECTLTTYDSVDEDETILMPKYEFNIVGYITWTPLEKETV